MQKTDFIFTSESVTEGHPDKVSDLISDSVLDAVLEQDPHSRVAVETLVKTGFVVLAGELTTKAYVDIPAVVRKAVCDIGYTKSDLGFDGNTCGILSAIEEQSPDIAMGVDVATNATNEQGAGDQGMMFGYACVDTPEFMPAPISFAHALTKKLAQVRKSGELPWLRPDGKSQVTVQYEGGRAKRIDTIVISTQHDENATRNQIEEAMRSVVIPVLPTDMIDNATKIHVNPTGRFVIGGPKGDSGVTGRKIIVDTYGGMGRHGGGAFSGKDPSKVDRSAAYMARYIAKNTVAAKLADRCEVQLAYAIGVAEPVSVMVDTFGTGKVNESTISNAIRHVFGLKPSQIVEQLRLLRPIYRMTTNYGHFGREIPECTWERTDKAASLADFCGIKS